MRYGTLFGMLALVVVPSGRATADTFEVSKASVTLPVVYQTLDSHGVQILATKTLKTADVVNLALGRSLATKVNKKTEVLALAGNATTPGADSQVVVFNPQTNTITAKVWDFGNDFVLLSNEDFSKNAAAGSMVFATTAVGDPVHNGFSTTTVTMGGTGKAQAVATSTAIVGPLSFKFTDASNVTTIINGLVLKGKFKSGGFLAVLL